MAGLPDWPRAHGEPPVHGQIRSQLTDFRVSEILGFEPSGSGEHDLLWVEKRGSNTQWLARQLAKHARIAAKDVGYSGLKDRHAVTAQWFSVANRQQPDWSSLSLDGVSILRHERHSRKLRRGTHKANRFEIVLRGAGYLRERTRIDDRLQKMCEFGVPNYFGPQRFGRNAGNLSIADAWARGERQSRQHRSLAISTVRSYLFNQSLGARVVDRSWNRIVAGDLVNLDGSASTFSVEAVDEELMRRCTEMDLHPTAPLAGADSPAVPNMCPDWQTALRRDRVDAGNRSLRLRLRDFDCQLRDDALILCFTLGRGAYATSVLRELSSQA